MLLPGSEVRGTCIRVTWGQSTPEHMFNIFSFKKMTNIAFNKYFTNDKINDKQHLFFESKLSKLYLGGLVVLPTSAKIRNNFNFKLSYMHLSLFYGRRGLSMCRKLLERSIGPLYTKYTILYQDMGLVLLHTSPGGL